MIRRRQFITLLGGAAAAWPVAARAQQAKRRVGVLMSWDDGPEGRSRLTVFEKAMRVLGWIEGRNIETIVRWGGFGQERVERIAAYAKELIDLKPDVILVSSTAALKPVQRMTSSIPIVFVDVSDPLGQDIVTSLARPTGNVTGFSNPEFSLLGKSLQLLKEIAPSVTRVLLITHSDNGAAPFHNRTFEKAAPLLAIAPTTATVGTRAEIERKIGSFAQHPNSGLLLPLDNFTHSNRDLVIALAARHRLPAIYAQRVFAMEGGLASYGVDSTEFYRAAASYIDRILRGEKPSDLPVQQPTRFELVLNLKTAKTLGLEIPYGLTLAADELIE